MIRDNKKYSIEEVLNKVDTSKSLKYKAKEDFDGDMIKVTSLRLYTFKEKGIKCVTCGIEGQYFVKEKTINDKSYHFNLYGINEDGEEVLITKDHIIPSSQGGKDRLENMQTMCKICNKAKGNKVES